MPDSPYPASGPAWPVQPWPGPPPPSPRDRVRAAWAGRAATDYLFDYWSALGWTVLTVGVFSFYVFYQLIRRMRDHNLRRIELLDASIAFAWEQAGRQGLQAELTPAFERAAAHMAELRRLAGEFREPAVWVVIALVARGIAEIVGFILLDQDLVRHDRAEGGVEHELAIIFGRLGHPIPPPDPARVKRPDNYAGRIVATVFTLGIYLFWWYYDQMELPNRHFRLSWAYDDALAGAVEALAAST